MKTRKYNYIGKDISNIKKELISNSFGYYKEDGTPVPYWKTPDEYVDEYGFDRTVVDSDGVYCRTVELPLGKMICRFGNRQGRLTTDVGTAYTQLALPYKPETVEYHEYRVIADGVKVQCFVKKGKVAPMFNSKGGGIQYLHSNTIMWEVLNHKLEEDFAWLN